MIGESLDPTRGIDKDWIDPKQWTTVRPSGNGYFVYCEKTNMVYQVTRHGRKAINAKKVPHLVHWITYQPPKKPLNEASQGEDE